MQYINTNYHTDVFGANNSSFRVGYSRFSGSLAYKGIHPTSLKEAVRASDLESETWVRSLVLPFTLSVSCSLTSGFNCKMMITLTCKDKIMLRT